MRKLNPWFLVPVVIAGIAGALIGRNIARVSCVPVTVEGAACDSTTSEIVLGVVGALVAVVGVGIVIALVITSLAEWRRQHSD